MKFFDFLRKKEASIPLYLKSAFSSFGSMAKKSNSEYYTGWVSACVRAIAEDIAKIELRLYRESPSGDRELITKHPALELLTSVNDFFSKSDLFERLQSNIELEGNEYWYLETNGGKGDPTAIYPLMPKYVTPVQGEKEYIDHYDYRLGAKLEPLPKENIVHFKTYNPTSDVLGLSTIASAKVAAITDELAKDYNQAFFRNSARPDVVIGFPETLTPEQEKRIRESWEQSHGGSSKGFKTAVASGGLTITPFQISQADMQFLEQRKFSRDEILAIFRVPPLVLGIADVTTYASAKAASYSFALRTIEPKLRRIISTLNEFYLPKFANTENLYFDFVSPAVEDRAVLMTEYTQGLTGGWLTINEIRKAEGMSEIEGGDTTFLPFNLVPFGKPIKSLKPASAMAKDIAKSVGEIITKDLKPKLAESKDGKIDMAKFETFGEGKAKARNSRGVKWEKAIAKAMAKLWEGQQERATENLNKYLNQKGSKAKVPTLLDLPAEVALTIDLMTPIFAGLTKDEAQEAAVAIGISAKPILESPALASFIKRNTKKFAGEITKETSAQLRASIAAGLGQGEGITELTIRVESLSAFNVFRAENIARTETIRAQTESELVVWDESGVVESKIWYTAQDERVCDDCAMMHGTKVDLGENFFDKGDTTASGLALDYSDVGGAPLHPQCRCTLIPELSAKSARPADVSDDALFESYLNSNDED